MDKGQKIEIRGRGRGTRRDNLCVNVTLEGNRKNKIKSESKIGEKGKETFVRETRTKKSEKNNEKVGRKTKRGPGSLKVWRQKERRKKGFITGGGKSSWEKSNMGAWQEWRTKKTMIRNIKRENYYIKRAGGGRPWERKNKRPKKDAGFIDQKVREKTSRIKVKKDKGILSASNSLEQGEKSSSNKKGIRGV